MLGAAAVGATTLEEVLLPPAQHTPWVAMLSPDVNTSYPLDDIATFAPVVEIYR